MLAWDFYRFKDVKLDFTRDYLITYQRVDTCDTCVGSGHALCGSNRYLHLV